MLYNDVIDIQIVTDVASMADEPVTLEEVKRHLNLQFDTSGSYDFDDDDTKLQDIIKQSRELLEQYTGVSMAVKTYRAILRNECGGMAIPFGPVTSITSVKDRDGVVLVAGQTYKFIGSLYEFESPISCYIEVEYTAGYTPTNIPQGLKRALLEQIAWNYVNAGDQQQQFASGTVAICESALAKAAPYSKRAWVS
jgi:uncharacterized phiE125 gp8 family phage protein